MLLNFAKAVINNPPFPRTIPGMQEAERRRIPAGAGLTGIFVLPLLLLFLASGISGCAGTPPEGNYVPASDSQPAPAAPARDVEAKHKYVLSLMADGNWHGAAELLEDITAARPKLSGPWVNLGIVRSMHGDSGAAEAAFKRALDVDAGNAEAHNQLGMLYRRTGRLEEARASYNAGLKRHPSHADLHWNLAILHDRYLPDPALALAHYEHYRQLTNSDDAQLQNWIAQLRDQVPEKEPASMTAEAKK
jgi:tetratricopeptide (TPR) repeat protein